MNKKLISKCCHSEVSESVYFTCLKCGQVCEVIEIEVSDTFIDDLSMKMHVKYLSKAKTAKINGEELTVLPYGYLRTAVKEALESQKQAIDKEWREKIRKILNVLNKNKEVALEDICSIKKFTELEEDNIKTILEWLIRIQLEETVYICRDILPKQIIFTKPSKPTK